MERALFWTSARVPSYLPLTKTKQQNPRFSFFVCTFEKEWYSCTKKKLNDSKDESCNSPFIKRRLIAKQMMCVEAKKKTRDKKNLRRSKKINEHMLQFILMIIAFRFEFVAFEEFTCIEPPKDLHRKSHSMHMSSYSRLHIHVHTSCFVELLLCYEYKNTIWRLKVTEETKRRRNNYRKQSANMKDTDEERIKTTKRQHNTKKIVVYCTNRMRRQRWNIKIFFLSVLKQQLTISTLCDNDRFPSW